MAGHDDAAESVWRFSLMFYAWRGVAGALIRLQDQRGYNVNLILYAIWLGLCPGVKLDTAMLADAKAAIEEIDRDVVAPLRTLRYALKDSADSDVGDLRKRVLALEIAAERRVLARLVTCVGHGTASGADDRLAATEGNLRVVLGADFRSTDASVLRRAIVTFGA